MNNNHNVGKLDEKESEIMTLSSESKEKDVKIKELTECLKGTFKSICY